MATHARAAPRGSVSGVRRSAVSVRIPGALPRRLSLCEARLHLASGELAREPGEVLRDELRSRAPQSARRRLERNERLFRLRAAAARATASVSAVLRAAAMSLD